MGVFGVTMGAGGRFFVGLVADTREDVVVVEVVVDRGVVVTDDDDRDVVEDAEEEANRLGVVDIFVRLEG